MTLDTQLIVFSMKSLFAEAKPSYGAPLTLHIESADGTAEVILYTGDQGLADRLAVAINQAVKPPKPSIVVCPQEIAAYAAAAKTWSGL